MSKVEHLFIRLRANFSSFSVKWLYILYHFFQLGCWVFSYRFRGTLLCMSVIWVANIFSQLVIWLWFSSCRLSLVNFLICTFQTFKEVDRIVQCIPMYQSLKFNNLLAFHADIVSFVLKVYLMMEGGDLRTSLYAKLGHWFLICHLKMIDVHWCD